MSPSILQDQLGIAEETTPGTGVTVTRFYDYGSENINASRERIEYMGIRPNRKVLGSNNWVEGRLGANGGLELPVMNKDFGLWFKHALGNVATTTPTGATTTRDHKCTVGAIDGKALTVQVGRTDVTGTTQPFTYAGCKITDWELAHDTSTQLMFRPTLDAISETTGTALATASYSTGLSPWAYTKVVLNLGGTAIDVTEWSLKAANNLATDRYLMRGSTPGSKKEQIEGANIREYTGDLKAEFTGLTDYNRFVSGTQATLTAIYTGGVIEGALNYQITVSLASVRIDGDTPNTQGLGIKEQSLPFTVTDSGAADGPVVIVIRTDQATP